MTDTKDFRYLNMSHKDPKYHAVKGSDKPCELHSIFNAMVASTKKRTPIMTEQKPTVKAEAEKKRTNWRGKTAEQHLTEAKSMTLFGVKVLNETPRKVGGIWQVLIECERCGSQKWVNKGDLTRTKSCGCLYAERAKKNRVEPKAEPFEVVEIVEKTVENEKKIALPKDDFKAFEENFVKVNSSQCDSNRDENDQKTDRVTVSRRLVMGLADETKKAWAEEDFWEMSPAVFRALIQDTQEIYEALQK